MLGTSHGLLFSDGLVPTDGFVHGIVCGVWSSAVHIDVCAGPGENIGPSQRHPGRRPL